MVGILVVGLTFLICACERSTTGIVVGGIQPCYGIAPQTPPGYAAGTVVVLRGVTTLKTAGPGVQQTVFPTETVTTALVRKDEQYRFSLPPGQYVLVAHLEAASVVPWVSVSVTAGQTTHEDIPNMCL
jgi:hypothetical protein